MTSRVLNATAELRFPKRWGRYRPHRPYRPTPRIHKGLRADGTSVACAQTVLDAPNPMPERPRLPTGREGGGVRRPGQAARRLATWANVAWQQAATGGGPIGTSSSMAAAKATRASRG